MNLLRLVSTAIVVTPAFCGPSKAGLNMSPHDGDRSTVVRCGTQSYHLAYHEDDERWETDEFRLVGEPDGGWTELVTVQRLKPDHPGTVAQLVEFIRSHREEAGWGAVQVEGQGPRACVFGAGIGARGGEAAFKVVGLIIDRGTQPGRSELVVIHHTTRLPKDESARSPAIGAQWRERFLRQAAQANSSLK